MKQYIIESVQTDISNGGISCGPSFGHVVVEVCVRDVKTREVTYHNLEEVEDTLTFTKCKESIYNGLIEENYDDEEFWNAVSKATVGEYADYDEFFEDLEKHETCNEDNELIWKYLVYMARVDWDEVDQMKVKSVGKVLGEFDIPVCDVEEEYMERNED